MRQTTSDRRVLVDRLRLVLPFSVRARQRLVERLRAFLPRDALCSCLLVTSVYDAGEELGILCQLDLTRHHSKVSHLVVPLDQITLDRRYCFDEKSGRQRLHVRRVSHTRSQ